MIRVDGGTFVRIYQEMLQVDSTSMHPVVFKYRDAHKIQYLLKNDALCVLYEEDLVLIQVDDERMRGFESTFKYVYLSLEDFDDD